MASASHHLTYLALLEAFHEHLSICAGLEATVALFAGIKHLEVLNKAVELLGSFDYGCKQIDSGYIGILGEGMLVEI